MTAHRLIRHVGYCFQPRDFRRQTTSGGKQEMPTAARGINDAELQNSLTRILQMLLHRAFDNWIERRFDKLLDKAIRGVFRAAELPLRSLGNLVCAITDEAKSPWAPVDIEQWVKFEQALINRAKLFR